MENNLWANMYCQNHCEINNRHVWHYLIDTAIGQINVIQWETDTKELETVYIPNDYDKAERKFHSVCRKLIAAKPIGGKSHIYLGR